MEMKVTGHCHCGQISFEAAVDSATVRVCHCTDCQKLTGTVFRAAIASLPGTFVLKIGKPKTYIKTAESGNDGWQETDVQVRHGNINKNGRNFCQHERR